MNDQDSPKFQLNTQQIIRGSILIGLGSVIALAGAAMAGTAFVAAYRDRVSQMEVPPTELARQHWNRARHAAMVGVGEWRNGSQPVEVPS